MSRRRATSGSGLALIGLALAAASLVLIACDPGVDWVVVNPCDEPIEVIYWLGSSPPDTLADRSDRFSVDARDEKVLGDLLGFFVVSIPALSFVETYTADSSSDTFRVEPAAEMCP